MEGIGWISSQISPAGSINILCLNINLRFKNLITFMVNLLTWTPPRIGYNTDTSYFTSEQDQEKPNDSTKTHHNYGAI